MIDSLDIALERIASGEPLSPDAVLGLAESRDILSSGMLADAQKRVWHGPRVTFLRVTACKAAGVDTWTIEPAARELRIVGPVDSFEAACQAVATARAKAGDRVLSAFSWNDVQAWAAASSQSSQTIAHELRARGLDALGEVALDGVPSVEETLAALASAGFTAVRVHVAKASAVVPRTELWLRLARAHASVGNVISLNPLPTATSAFKPTTGYDDVKAVALARLAVPTLPHVQVDWQRYGPKLAQVALTFGADDVDGVSASDDAPEGRRRAPLEEIRRNIEAAGFEPAERDGRFDLVPA
jgi:aminodeoxyfutalosine synthase